MTVLLGSKRYMKALVLMFGIYLVANSLLAVMAIYAKNLTGQDAYAGMMTSLFTLGALSVRFLAGKLSDRYSSKIVILVGILMMMIGTALYLVQPSIGLALFARAVQGIGFGLSATATSTLIAFLCPPNRLLEGIGYSSVAMSISFVLGPAIGFAIIGAQYDRFSILFTVSLAMAIALFLMLIQEKAQVRAVGNPALETSPRHISQQTVKWAVMILPTLILFINSLTQSAVVSFLAIYAISQSFAGIGAYFSINAAGMITSRFIMSRLVQRFGAFPMVLVNTIIFGFSIFGITQVRSAFALNLLAFPAGFAMGAIAPIINTHLLQNVPDKKKGFANAIYYSALDIGYGVGSVAWGFWAGKINYSGIFLAAAALQIIAAILAAGQMNIETVAIRNEKSKRIETQNSHDESRQVHL